MGKFESLIGKQFGRWLVLERAENKIYSDGKSRPAWLCECQCEKHTRRVIGGAELRNGMSKSCGCLKIEKARERGIANKKENRYDLTGEYGIGYASNTGREFYFDLEDYDRISNYCWFERRTYIGTADKETGKIIMLHKMLTDTTTEQEVDHINRKPWDNRKANLRICTHLDNMKNMSKRIDNTSGVSGVVYDNARGKWMSRITFNKKTINLGRFDSKDDAIKARLEAEAKYFGEFAPQRNLFVCYGVVDITSERYEKDDE